MGVDRSSMRYRSRRGCDVVVRLRIRELAAQRRRFGYRRLHVLLTREGCRTNQKRFRRLYREEKLQVRKRGGRKRALRLRAPIALPHGPNERGRSTSYPTASQMAGASASWRSSTTSRARAWR
jgi:putative transposase